MRKPNIRTGTETFYFTGRMPMNRAADPAIPVCVPEHRHSKDRHRSERFTTATPFRGQALLYFSIRFICSLPLVGIPGTGTVRHPGRVHLSIDLRNALTLPGTGTVMFLGTVRLCIAPREDSGDRHCYVLPKSRPHVNFRTISSKWPRRHIHTPRKHRCLPNTCGSRTQRSLAFDSTTVPVLVVTCCHLVCAHTCVVSLTFGDSPGARMYRSFTQSGQQCLSLLRVRIVVRLWYGNSRGTACILGLTARYT